MVRSLFVISFFFIWGCVIVEPPDPLPEPLIIVDIGSTTTSFEALQIELTGVKFSPQSQSDWLILTEESVQLDLKDLELNQIIVLSEQLEQDSLFQLRMELGELNFVQIGGKKLRSLLGCQQ